MVKDKYKVQKIEYKIVNNDNYEFVEFL